MNIDEIKTQRAVKKAQEEARALFQDMVKDFSFEMERLQKVEQDYMNLLTLVTVVADQKRLSLDQHIEIKLSKKDQMKSKSWMDLLQIHFDHGNGLVKE